MASDLFLVIEQLLFAFVFNWAFMVMFVLSSIVIVIVIDLVPLTLAN